MTHTTVEGLTEAFARCTPSERQEADRHLGELVVVGGRIAAVEPYTPAGGNNSGNRIRVTFPTETHYGKIAPAAVQEMIDLLTFGPDP
jgi:hypothetical protein